MLPQANWDEERAKGGITDAAAAAPAKPPARPAGPLKFREDDDSVPEGVDQPMRLNSLTTEEWRDRWVVVQQRAGRWLGSACGVGACVLGWRRACNCGVSRGEAVGRAPA